MSDAPEPPSFSPAEVARRLGVSAPTVQRWVDSGHLKAWKTVGGHRRIDAQSAERLIAERRSGMVGEAPAAPAVAVMVVDDNPDDCDILAALVETALPGAAIRIAESGFQALVAMGQSMPDILITDIVMPHMNGLEMLRELTTRMPVRPGAFIAVSSKTREQVAKLGVLPADVTLLSKPIDHFEFIAAVQAAAAQRVTR